MRRLVRRNRKGNGTKRKSATAVDACEGESDGKRNTRAKDRGGECVGAREEGWRGSVLRTQNGNRHSRMV